MRYSRESSEVEADGRFGPVITRCTGADDQKAVSDEVQSILEQLAIEKKMGTTFKMTPSEGPRHLNGIHNAPVVDHCLHHKTKRDSLDYQTVQTLHPFVRQQHSNSDVPTQVPDPEEQWWRQPSQVKPRPSLAQRIAGLARTSMLHLSCFQQLKEIRDKM